ncbi:putative monooxygenase, partial [Lineolata rhizophorae]
ANIPSIVFEKHRTLTSEHRRDWNMGLHWGAPLLRSLLPASSWSRIQTVQVDPHAPTPEHDHLNFLNAQTGEVMNALPVSFFYRLRRAKLRSLLAEGVDVRFGKRLHDASADAPGTSAPGTSTVTARFSDGTRATGAAVVGADGARSKVRSLLLGPSAGTLDTLPLAATFVQARYPRDRALFLRSFHPLYLGGIHPGGHFAFFGLHDAAAAAAPESWTFFFYISWRCGDDEDEGARLGWGDRERLAQAKRFAAGFAEPWRSAYDWLPDEHPVWYMRLTEWDPGAPGHGWDGRVGRVTLAGDAAHAMTYQRGQGLNHSVADADKLVGAVKAFVGGEVSRAQAMEAYEEEMKRRAGEEVRTSTLNSKMLHDWEKVLASPLFKSGMTKTEGKK